MVGRILRPPLVVSDTTRLFFFGTLRDPQLLEIVAGKPVETTEAWISGFETRIVGTEGFPILVPATEDSIVKGVLVEVGPEVLERISFYEVGFELQTISVATEDGFTETQIFAPSHDTWEPREIWSFENWKTSTAPLTRAAIEEFMRLFGSRSPEKADRFYDQMETRAASKLRAQAEPSPDRFSPTMVAAPVSVAKTYQPYSEYFSVLEHDLSFPRFDGTASQVVRRASFMGGDAVTILPFDPKAGTVLMVRQFRHGPFSRGDTNPWCVEPVAGRIDAGETPEQAAHREMLEETGLEVANLIEIARYYPSPGAYSEFLYSYVAEADLSSMDGTFGGVAGEAEDILSHVLTLEEALSLIPSGAINTAPLILSLQWLAANRDRFASAD